MNPKCGVEGFKVRSLHHLECDSVRCTTRMDGMQSTIAAAVSNNNRGICDSQRNGTLLRLAFRKQHRSQIATNYKCHFGQAKQAGSEARIQVAPPRKAVCRPNRAHFKCVHRFLAEFPVGRGLSVCLTSLICKCLSYPSDACL